MDPVLHPQRPSRARATAVAVVALLLCGACGEERAQAPPEKSSPPGGARGEAAPRDRFSVQTGEACSLFYAEVTPLQIELQRLQGKVRRDPKARERAKEVVKEVQSRSRAFVSRLKQTPPPSSPRRRQDASRLRASTDEFVRLQGESLELVSGLLDEPDRISRADKARLSELRTRLGAELREQQALLGGLDVPECLP